MLNVSGPFHSPLLAGAAEELERELLQTPFSDPDIPYITNVTAQPVTEKEPIRALLARQICAPVRWMQSMQRMLADGVDTFVEIGAGKTLAAISAQAGSECECLSGDDVGRSTDCDRKAGGPR